MTGAKKLTQLYTKLIAEGSSGSPPVSGFAFMLTKFPGALMSSLTPLIEFSIWIENLLKVTEADYALLPKLVPLSSNTLITTTYDTILTPLLTFSRIPSLAAQIHVSYVLEGSELRDSLVVIRSGGELSGGLADITVSTVQYLNRIPDVQDAVASASVEVNEKVTIQHFVYDAINTLIGSLTTLSRTQHQPPFGSVFLLNNVSYLASHLVLRPTNPNTPSLLFSPLMQALADDTRYKTSGSRWKAAAKEKFTRFYDLTEEVGEQHRMAKVLEEDSEERSAVGEEVVKLVVPSFQRFMRKQKEKEFSKNPPKCKSSCIFARICFF
ncbi:Cullin repeat-like-containing domain protein [Suillus occidentalis]|nr:Cullin repeat-like-containing domain protein [Suillus occidentalis]